MGTNANPLPKLLKKWLLGSVGKKGSVALAYCNNIGNYVPKNEQILSRKQQYFMFIAIYEHYYKITARVLSKGTEIDGVILSADLRCYQQDIQDVLVDLTYRGDNFPITRKYFMKDLLNRGESFKRNMSNPDWKKRFGVPAQRFIDRKNYLK